MGRSVDEVLNPKEAARRIFGVDAPSQEQIATIVSLLKSGVIRRASPAAWTTTVADVAEYLARRESQRLDPRDRKAQALADAAVRPGGESVAEFYQDLIRDYFLAVLLKRKFAARSGAFQRVVVISQAVFLALGLLTIGLALFQITKQPWISPEQKLVQAWLDAKFSGVRVVEVTRHATQDDAVLARFSYVEGSRVIQSRLKFTLRAGQVVTVDSSD